MIGYVFRTRTGWVTLKKILMDSRYNIWYIRIFEFVCDRRFETCASMWRTMFMYHYRFCEALFERSKEQLHIRRRPLQRRYFDLRYYWMHKREHNVLRVVGWRDHVGITWDEFQFRFIVYWERVMLPWRRVMSNLKELGPFSGHFSQHNNRDDRFHWYYRVMHVFCDNTIGIGSLYDLRYQEGFSSVGLVVHIWVPKSSRLGWPGLVVDVFYRNGNFIACCDFLLN